MSTNYINLHTHNRDDMCSHELCLEFYVVTEIMRFHPICRSYLR